MQDPPWARLSNRRVQPPATGAESDPPQPILLVPGEW